MIMKSLKSYVKLLWSQENKKDINSFQIKQFAKNHCGHNNYLYSFRVCANGEELDFFYVFVSKERSQAFNRSKGFDCNRSCNNGFCLHSISPNWFIYNDNLNFGAWKA